MTPEQGEAVYLWTLGCMFVSEQARSDIASAFFNTEIDELSLGGWLLEEMTRGIRSEWQG